jgi:rubrerythrin
MAEMKGSDTEKNLQEAFAGESQANRKYLAFAKKADAEGHPRVARLFRAAAAAETVHAHAHLRAMKGVGSTEENLKEARGGEIHEFESMYPPMLAKAKEEDLKGAEKSFEFALAVEKIHASLYEKALSKLGGNEEVSYYVCSVCGNTIEGAPQGSCPICGAAKDAFFLVE